jgi:Flp pilus assembly pilin Flp
VPEGGLLLVDDREERSFLSGLDFSVKAATATPERLRAGLLLAASAVRDGGDRFAVHLGVHLALPGTVREIRGGRVTRLCPEVDFATLVATIPVAPGSPGTIALAKPGGGNDFRVEVTVSPAPSPPEPSGTRARFLGARMPLLTVGPLPAPGRPLPDAPADPAAESRAAAIPESWRTAAGPEVRLLPVEPGLAVLIGAEKPLSVAGEALDRLAREERPAVHVEYATNAGTITAALLGGAPLTLVRGRTVPELAGLEEWALSGMQNRAPRVTRVFEGRSLRIEVTGPDSARVWEGRRGIAVTGVTPWEEGR